MLRILAIAVRQIIIRNLKQRAQGLQTFAFYIVNVKKEVGVKFKDCLCVEL